MLANRKMKDSGIEWIGEIPEDWSISKVKHCFIKKNSKAKQDDPVVLSLARSGVKVRDISNNEGQLAESYYDYNPVQVGDLLLNPMDLYSGANCSYSNVEGVISPAYINLKKKENVSNPKFYDYYFKVQYWMMVLFSFGKGVSFDNRWTLGQETLMNFPLAYPSLQEQQKIADFLDEKCKHIDAVLEKTRASIEEYKQLKQSVITKAVTKGIRPNRPMKDSGIEWIGQIPDDWSTPKLKHLANLFGRIGFRGYKAEDLVEEGQGAITLSPSNFHDMQMDYSKLTYLSWFKYNESPEIMAFDNDIIFVKTGSTYGKSALITNLPCEATINPQNLLIKDVKTNIKYLLYYLNSEYTNYQVEQTVVGGTIPTIAQSKIENYYVLKPPMQEQKEIVTYLDTKCAEIDKLIKKKEQLIEELETYKKSLIYEYVTGKKEVC